MNGADHLIVLGEEHPTASGLHVAQGLNGSAAYGISTGYEDKPNEDALALARVGADALIAIADGHWGNEASRIAVSMAMRVLTEQQRPAVGQEMRSRLYLVFEQINAELFRLASAAPGSASAETTLIVCFVRTNGTNRDLVWASFGDSSLYVYRDGELRELNRPERNWLGALSKMAERSAEGRIQFTDATGGPGRWEYSGVASSLQTGIASLAPDELLLLCTDGVADLIRDGNLPAGIFGRILSADDSLELKVKRLLSHAMVAMGHDRPSNDNLSCVLLQSLAAASSAAADAAMDVLPR